MKEQKCLFVTIAGLPNAGKSTLINSIVGKKIAIVTPKAQTTRTQTKGITIRNKTQIIFTDSPGIFSAGTKLEKAIVRSAWSAIKGDDITLLLVDISNYLKSIERIKIIFARLQHTKIRCILVINKVDLVNKPKVKMAYRYLSLLYRFEKIFIISALKSNGLPDLINYLSEVAPVSPWFYREDQITDSSTSFLSAETTREKLSLNLREELPYSTAVITEQFQEKKDKSLVIKQVIFVLKDSHKKIVLGKNGSCIKKISIEARSELEKLFERKVHLFLFVKVRSWTDCPEEYINDA
ncbi:GTPase Era [Wolbachia endosymbiont of Dirofilaria (Dirofilaria) immitis]|uniref:GTPase Era n=1 Tax=Wolbachia endosymbiont of Dirofilaria (Dirofilaria) immitis TaxID=1812115 RepID=UPI00158D11BB|nr:GTPase Era [Wolbachia endosymbiont of Dirofilaria (Dirofilaria) immitis]QKX02581.1 GTPase Era [Wolbachia endosymbiont of Dirofilaria (Dirofilaria) immitis]